jgi:serine phosphatase RsbU (regulator of sigma subunit)
MCRCGGMKEDVSSGMRMRTGSEPGVKRSRPWRWLLSQGALIAPFVLLAAAAVSDLLLPSHWTVVTVCLLAPALTTLVVMGTRRILLVGAVTLVVVVVLIGWRWPERRFVAIGAPGSVVAMTIISLGARRNALRRERRLAQTQAVAETVQRALLRPVPRQLGGLQLEARYVGAASEAQVGGDIYEAAWTPFGIRLMIGDVMGKGLAAVETASALVGAFREAVFDEEDLSALAWRLQVSATRRLGPDIFATVLFLTVTVAGDRAEMVSCGHPPPLLLSADGAVAPVRIKRPCPPIGMLELCSEHTLVQIALEPGDSLLLYTDGVTEARDADGAFFPLTDQLARSPEWTLDNLLTELLRHSGGRLNDDAALLFAQRTTSAARAGV